MKTRQLSDHFKAYFTVGDGYRGGSSGDPTQHQTIHKLSSNENPYGASPKVIEALSSAARDLHIYPDHTDTAVREQLTLVHEGVASDQFIVANSGSEVLQMIIKGFVKVGDNVIVSSPYFVPYRSFSLWEGAEVVDVPLIQPDYRLDVAGILSAVDERTRIVFLTSPNNPTGSYISRKELDELMHGLPSDVLVVYDEVYWHYIDQPDYPRAVDYLDRYDNIVGLNSFSKAYGLASMRIGYGYFSSSVAHYLRQICRPFLLPKFSIVAAIAALSDQEWIQSCVKHNAIERDYLYSAIEDLDIPVWSSNANFLMIKPAGDHIALVDYLADQGIYVRPLDNYMAPGAVRITVGTRANSEALLKALRGYPGIRQVD